MITKKLLAIPLTLGMVALTTGVWPASAQTGQRTPRVAIQLASTGLTSPIIAGMSDAVMARLLLDTTNSSEPVRVASLPFNLLLSNGANAGDLNNCEVYDEDDSRTIISRAPELRAGINHLELDPHLVLEANTLTTVALRCDVGDDLNSGATFTFSMNTATFTGAGENTGDEATITVLGATSTPTTPTTTSTPPTDDSTDEESPAPTPSLPTTGAGGQAGLNISIIIGSLLTTMTAILYAKSGKPKPRRS